MNEAEYEARQQCHKTCKSGEFVDPENGWLAPCHNATECTNWKSFLQASQLEDAREALRPFASSVFNDNGDVTISTAHLTVDDYIRAGRAFRNMNK